MIVPVLSAQSQSFSSDYIFQTPGQHRHSCPNIVHLFCRAHHPLHLFYLFFKKPKTYSNKRLISSKIRITYSIKIIIFKQLFNTTSKKKNREIIKTCMKQSCQKIVTKNDRTNIISPYINKYIFSFQYHTSQRKKNNGLEDFFFNSKTNYNLYY